MIPEGFVVLARVHTFLDVRASGRYANGGARGVDIISCKSYYRRFRLGQMLHREQQQQQQQLSRLSPFPSFTALFTTTPNLRVHCWMLATQCVVLSLPGRACAERGSSGIISRVHAASRRHPEVFLRHSHHRPPVTSQKTGQRSADPVPRASSGCETPSPDAS